MTISIIFVIAGCVIATQCAVLRHEDAVHKRVARSPGCHTCDHDAPPPPWGFRPPPPPPPPFFHTENWSGLARNADGSHRAVFSGAAAAAGESLKSSGEAFSLASSSVDGGYKGDGQHSSGFDSDRSGGQQKSSNFESHKYSGRQTQSNLFNGNDQQQAHFGGGSASKADSSSLGTSGQGQRDRYGGSFPNSGRGDQGEQQEESSNSGRDYSGSQSDSNSGSFGQGSEPKPGFNGQNVWRDESKQQQQQGYGSGGFSGSQSFSQSGRVSGHENSGSYKQGSSHGYGYGSNGANSLYRHEESNANQQQLQSSGSDHGEWEQFNDGTKGSSSSHKEAHTALKGALDLTSEGLKAAEHTGCSSCGKSSYAVSNAKSDSGSAVAVSIGG